MKKRNTAIWTFATAAILLLSGSVSAQASKPAPRSQSAQDGQKSDPLRALLQKAADALKAGNYAAAAEPLAEYLKQKPEDAEAHFQLGFVLGELGRRAEARSEYERAIEQDPKLVPAHINLGLMLLEEEPSRAAECFRAAASLQPDKARPRYLLGRALENGDKKSDALAAFRSALELEPKSFDAQFAVGRLLLDTGDSKAAEAEFRAAIELDGTSAAARLGLAESLYLNGKLAEAAREFATYLESRPEDMGARTARAAALVESESDAEALAELETVSRAGQMTGKGFELRADIYVRQKQWDLAAAALQAGLQAEPENAPLRARLGRIFLEKRQFAPAEAELRRALEIQPSLTVALRDLFSTLYLSEQYGPALGALDELEKREAPQPAWWFIRATCYDKLGRMKEALAAYERFVELDQGRSQNQNFQAEGRIRMLKRQLEKKR